MGIKLCRRLDILVIWIMAGLEKAKFWIFGEIASCLLYPALYRYRQANHW